MNIRVSFSFFVIFLTFCYVPDVKVENLVVEPGKGFYLKVNLSYVSNGYLELNLPKCFEYQKEIYIGDVYNERTFYLRVKSKCKEGIYLGNITVRARDYYYGSNYRDVVTIKQFFIYVGDFPKIEYEPKVVVKGANRIKVYSNGIKICVDNICSENFVEVLKDIDNNIEEFNFCFEKAGIRFCKKINLYFELIRPYYMIEDIGDNYITLKVYPKKAFVCLQSEYPIILKKNCKFTETGKVTFWFEKKPSSLTVKFLNLTIGEYKFNIPIENIKEGKIKVLYGGIDYSNKKTIIIIFNDGDSPLDRITVKFSEGNYYIERLNPGEAKVLKIPYKFKHTIEVSYRDGKERKTINFTINPKIVYFKEKEEKEGFWEKIIPISLFTFSIGMLIGVKR